jgi:hypothetical protein
MESHGDRNKLQFMTPADLRVDFLRVAPGVSVSRRGQCRIPNDADGPSPLNWNYISNIWGARALSKPSGLRYGADSTIVLFTDEF